MRKAWVCRLLASHKWVPIRVHGEAGEEYSRCGRRRFGESRGAPMPPSIDVGGGAGADGGGVGL
jgi:hypothetical protein